MKGARQLILSGGIGKLIGVLRELLLAAIYGTGAPAAAWRVAQSSTLIPIQFFTADALAAGFLPNHSRLLSQDPRRAYVLYQVVNRFMLAVGVLLTIAVGVGHSVIIGLLAPGLDAPTTHLAASMLFVMTIAVPLYLSANMASYVEMSCGRFHLAARRPSLQSIGLITGTIAAWLLHRPILLAWGFTGAYAYMAAIGLFSVRRLTRDERRGGPVEGFGTREALALFWRSVRPVLLVPIASQGALAVERIVASLVSSSSVAALEYARLVSDTANVLVAAPIGLAVLANFGHMTHDEARPILTSLLERTFVVLIPLSWVLTVGARPITEIVFQRGEFNASSTAVTAEILAGLSLGLWAQVGGYICVKSLNATGRNKDAAISVICGALVWIAADLLLFHWIGAAAIGVGASTGAIVQLGVSAALSDATGWPGQTLVRYVPMSVVAAGLWIIGLFVVPDRLPLQIGMTTLVGVMILATIVADPHLRRQAVALTRAAARPSAEATPAS